jgi:hypothetical protein
MLDGASAVPVVQSYAALRVESNLRNTGKKYAPSLFAPPLTFPAAGERGGVRR